MAVAMQVREIRNGLWQWTAPHPDWRPGKGGAGGWEEEVACVFHERPGASAVVVIDPLIPASGADRETFFTALERDLDRCGLPLAILLGNHHHERSARELYERYRLTRGASVWVSRAAIGRVETGITRPFLPGEPLPCGIETHALPGLEDTEIAYFLPAAQTLVFADAVLGAGGGRLRVAPESWSTGTPEGIARYKADFRPALRRLLDLDVEAVLVSHGDSVTMGGRRALAEALEAPAWGEA